MPTSAAFTCPATGRALPAGSTGTRGMSQRRLTATGRVDAQPARGRRSPG